MKPGLGFGGPKAKGKFKRTKRPKRVEAPKPCRFTKEKTFETEEKFGLEIACGGDMDDHHRIIATPLEALRAAGLSGQKASYVVHLAQNVASGALDFGKLPVDDDEAIAALTAVKGIGRWSAEIYLLFAEGRPDIFPAGDLAIQIELGKILGLEKRPSEKATRDLAEPWRPHRGALATFLWHSYNINAL